MIKLSKLKLDPDNPRLIKDDRYMLLVESLRNDPEIMTKQKIYIESWDNPIIGVGSQRYRALKNDLNYKEIPEEWLGTSEGLTPEQWERFKVLSNTHYGKFDIKKLTNQYDIDWLNNMGVEMPSNILAKSFQYEGGTYEEEKMPYPITIIVTKEDYEHWIKIKEVINIKNDKKAFFKIIESML